MKHSKWLFTLVVILLLINALFFSTWYFMGMQNKVKRYVESLLSNELRGNVKIEKLIFNDRIVTANQITFSDYSKKVTFSIKQCKIKYNLLKIIAHKFRVSKAITHITIIEPNLMIKYTYQPSIKKEMIELPDLLDYFKTATIINGIVTFTLELNIGENGENIIYIDRFKNVYVKIKNSNKTEFSVQGNSQKNGNVNLIGILEQRGLKNVQVSIKDYSPLYIQTTYVKQLQTKVNLDGTFFYSPGTFHYNIYSYINDTSFLHRNIKVTIPTLKVMGDDKLLTCTISDSYINNTKIKITGFIHNPLENPKVSTKFTFLSLQLKDFYPDLSGSISGEGVATWNGKGTYVNVTFNSSEMKYKNQIVRNIQTRVEYKEHTVSFSTNSFLYRTQFCNVLGSYNLNTHILRAQLNTFPQNTNVVPLIYAELETVMEFKGKYPDVDISFNRLDFLNNDISILNLSGRATVTAINNTQFYDYATNYYLESFLYNDSGLKFYISGDLLKPNLSCKVNLKDLHLTKYLNIAAEKNLSAILDAQIDIELNKKSLNAYSYLKFKSFQPIFANGSFSSNVFYNLDESLGNVSISSDSLVINGKPLKIMLHAKTKQNQLEVTSLQINNDVQLTALYNLKTNTINQLGFIARQLNLNNYLSVCDILPENNIKGTLDCIVNYNTNNDNLIEGNLTLDRFTIYPLRELSFSANLFGSIDNVNFTAKLNNATNALLNCSGRMKLNNEPMIYISGNLSIDDIEKIVTQSDISGKLNSYFNIEYSILKKNKSYNNIDFTLSGSDLQYKDFILDTLLVNAKQTSDQLIVNKLYCKALDDFEITGKGALDFKLSTLNFVEGNNALNLTISGDLFDYLDKRYDYVTAGKGKLFANLEVRFTEEGFVIDSGNLSLSKGRIQLKDQLEPISNIEFLAEIKNNDLIVNKAVCYSGEGKILIKNAIDPSGDNFNIGNLNLGYFMLTTDDTNIFVHIPGFMPAKTYAKASLKGRKGKDAIIKGPFDDIKIEANIIVSNGSFVYPENTKNLLQLIDLTKNKSNESVDEDIPLPITLDMYLFIDENVRYITYPANFKCLPKSFLHLNYNGQEWDVPEAEFSSEEGTLDFYGTTFNVDFLKLVVNAKQQIVSINGTFTKKTQDGSTITLTVYTSQHKKGNTLNRLEFKLSSDNPEDRSITQILSKLRYNRKFDELTQEQRQTLFQDEALKLIGTSVNTTYFSQIFSPVENAIRKFFKLDTFTINSGFIQNLFVEYGSNRNQDRVIFSDISNLNADIMQFSSSILLNNLNINMGKYLNKKIFIDYNLLIQETTNLAKQSSIVMYHDASIRTSLPWQLRLVYTFKLRPEGENNSHEIMLLRSFHF